MIYSSKAYTNRRGTIVVLDSSTVVSNKLHDAIAIVSLIIICIASSIVTVA